MAFTDEDKIWLESKLTQSFTQMREYLDGRLDQMKEYIDERTHDAETRLLRGFADYNTSSSIRFQKLEADASNLNTSSTQRLGELERQLASLHAKVILIEGRLPNKPAAN